MQSSPPRTNLGSRQQPASHQMQRKCYAFNFNGNCNKNQTAIRSIAVSSAMVFSHQSIRSKNNAYSGAIKPSSLINVRDQSNVFSRSTVTTVFGRVKIQSYLIVLLQYVNWVIHQLILGNWISCYPHILMFRMIFASLQASSLVFLKIYWSSEKGGIKNDLCYSIQF